MVRADANSSIGTGHVMRCLALAQAWLDSGAEVVFVTENLLPVLSERLKAERIKVLSIETYDLKHDAGRTVEIARDLSVEWIIVDGYKFDSEYHRKLKNDGFRVLCIDGIGHIKHYYADIVLNNNIGREEDLYLDRQSYTKLLLGSQYILLRREFTSRRIEKRKIANIAKNLLITLGGGDTYLAITKVLQALNNLNNYKLHVKVVLGYINYDIDKLKSIINNTSIDLLFLQNVEEMQDLMIWADFAISAGGTTCWEIAYYGLPNIVLVLAENQKENATFLYLNQVSIYAGEIENISIFQLSETIERLMINKKLRRSMSQRGQQLIDGLGSSRVKKILMDLI